MKYFMSYLNGITVGICIEYLYRVGYSIYPVIIISCSILVAIIDLSTPKTKKK